MSEQEQPSRVGNILTDLESLAFPVDMLMPLPGNPRQGDVKAVARSYAAFGQRKPLVARKQGNAGIVIAGNHQLEAAISLGWTHVAVVWVDDDDTTAAAFALADNRSADLGTYDDNLLLDLIMSINDAELLQATGYNDADIAALMKQDDISLPAGDESDQLLSMWAVVITCDNESQQLELIRRFVSEGLECKALVS